MDQRVAQGMKFSLDEAIAIVVPLCLDLKERHDRGEQLYVHPSCIAPGPDGLARLQPQLAVVPTNAHDRACLAPELQRTLSPGNSRASVFSVGAVLYELLTGATIGPAMRRPRDYDPSLPEAFEVLLSKALVGDPAHRPEDLGALAAAMHHLAPMKSIPPPDVDTSTLDHTDSFDVDVRLSMLPPSEVSGSVAIPQPAALPNMGGDPFGNVVEAPQAAAPVRNDPTQRLASLKERLESDPRPRYVVNKDKMDHGPFSAIELLQQIASNVFSGKHTLRDEISGQSREISEWEEFAPFAEQAALKREIVQEKKEVARAVEDEKKAGVAKSAFGIAIVLVLLGIGGIFIYKKVGHRNDGVAVGDDKGGFVVDPAGSIKGAHKAQAHGGGGGGGFGGGLSFEEAWSHAEQKVTIGGGGGGRDLTQGELAGPLQNASFVSGCGAPDSMKITVKAAIQNGHVVGVSVYTTPPNGAVSGCIAGAVRRIPFPVSPNMDAITTSY
jgi:eukaryotic-like serine/threonine-protein kinase